MNARDSQDSSAPSPNANQAPSRVRSWPKGGNTRIPSWVYSDRDVFEREMELFFAGPTWNYVGLACEVPEPGCFKRQWIGTKPVVMVRNQAGDIRVFENRCAHRQAQICWQNTGKTKDFTCPYHQWNYDLDGRLRGMPFRRGANGEGGMPADFDLKVHGLKALRVTTRGGSVWASFSQSAPSFEDYCGPEVLAEIDHMFPADRPLKLLGTTRQLIPANWKMYLENLKDPYHATLLHTFYITFGLWRADSGGECIPTGGGKHSVMISFNRGKKVTDTTSEMSRFRNDLRLNDLETVTPRKEFNAGRVGGAWVFPATQLGIQANTLKTRLVIPRSPTEHELVITHYGFVDDDEEMSRLRLKHANLLGPAGFVSIDDSEMLTQVQLGAGAYPDSEGVIEMGGRDTEPARYMVSEVMIRAFYAWYREQMGFDDSSD